MAGSRSRLFPELAGKRWNVWTSHERVRNGEWRILLHDLSQRAAIEEMVARQDQVRRTGQPAKFRALIEGEEP